MGGCRREAQSQQTRRRVTHERAEKKGGSWTTTQVERYKEHIRDARENLRETLREIWTTMGRTNPNDSEKEKEQRRADRVTQALTDALLVAAKAVVAPEFGKDKTQLDGGPDSQLGESEVRGECVHKGTLRNTK